MVQPAGRPALAAASGRCIPAPCSRSARTTWLRCSRWTSLRRKSARIATSTSPVRCSTCTGCGGPLRSIGPTGWRRHSIRRRASTTSTRARRRPARTSRIPLCRRRITTPQAGARRLTTETGAGQWGTALAFACAQFGLDCEVWQVRASFDQKPYRRIMMETFGARRASVAVRSHGGGTRHSGRTP